MVSDRQKQLQHETRAATGDKAFFLKRCKSDVTAITDGFSQSKQQNPADKIQIQINKKRQVQVGDR